jgi:ribonuclease R
LSRDRFVGVVSRRGKFLVAEPLFEPGAQVPLRGGVRVRPSAMVVVARQRGGARAVADLGSPERALDVASALLSERGLERGFDQRIEADARAAIEAARSTEPGRRDFTGMATFTVDPSTARDFDDAVSAAREGDGVRLWIHIADVAAHVRPGSALDAAALQRAVSTYVPGTVEPMLP